MSPLQLTPDEWTAVLLSLKVGLAAVAASLPVGVALAFVLARGRFPGKALLDALVHLPLVLPPVVTGYGMLLAFGRRGPVGRVLEELFGVTLAFRWTGAALAAAVMGLPLLVRSIRLSFEAIDPRMEVAARTLGAGPFRVFRTVTLPLAMPGILAGAVLAFARGLGEFGATITFVASIPGETRTLPLAIYSLLQSPGGEAAALRLSVLAVLVSLAALLASEGLARRMRSGRPHA